MLKKYTDKILFAFTKDTRLKSIGLTSIGSVLTRVVQVLVGLITVPLALNYLGVERYGLMMTIVTLISMISFSDLGLGMGLQNKIPELNQNKKYEELKELTSGTFFLLVLIAFFLLMIFLCIYPFVNWNIFFNLNNPKFPNEASLSVLVFFLVFILGLPFAIVQRIQDGFQQGYVNQMWFTLNSLLGFVLLYISVKQEYNIPTMILAIYGANSILTIINFLYHFIKIRPYLFPKYRKFSLTYFQKLFSGSISFFILQLTNVIFQSADSLIIAKTLGIKEVAMYSIGLKLVNIMILPVSIVVPSYLPVFNEAIMKNDKVWVKKMLLKNLILIFGISILTSIITFFFTNALIHTWISPQLNLSNDFIIALCLFIFLMNYNLLFSYIGLTNQFVKQTAIYYPLAVIITIILKILFLPVFGLAGIVWITILCFPLFFFLPLFLKLRSNNFI